MDRDLLENRVKRVMADVLELDVGMIRDNTSAKNTATWDSLNSINVVLALEEEFSVTFEVEEMEAMTSFGALVREVKAKLDGIE